MRPGDTQALALSEKIIASFNDAERTEMAAERAAFYTEQYKRAFSEADTAFKANNADTALTAITRAIQFDSKNPEAAALKNKIEVLQTDQSARPRTLARLHRPHPIPRLKPPKACCAPAARLTAR